MRSLIGLLTTFAAFTIGTTALEASVITFGNEVQRQNLVSSVVSSATLQQLLELRSQSLTASILEGTDEDSVELLSQLAGRPTTLFGKLDRNDHLDTILIILEGLGSEVGSLIRHEYTGNTVTSKFDTASAKDTFLAGLLEGPRAMVNPESKHCSFSENKSLGFGVEKDFMQSCLPGVFNSRLLSEAQTGESWTNVRENIAVVHATFETPKGSLSYEDEFRSLLSDMRILESNGGRATVVLSDSTAAKRSSHRRGTPQHANVDSAVNRVGNIKAKTIEKRSQAPLTLLPVCYSSNSSCNDATDSCSGNGACDKKSDDCYACRCYETYGGSACQKKDISSPFFLIAGVTIGITVAIGGAIGMIFRVGDTELPGVISAGVGAARVQK